MVNQKMAALFRMFMYHRKMKCYVDVSVGINGVSYSCPQNGATSTVTIPGDCIIQSEVILDEKDNCTRLHYVNVLAAPGNKVSFQAENLKFHGTEVDCLRLKESTEQIIEANASERPRRLLAFINPISGWMNSVRLYHDLVEPVFSLFNIDVVTIVTEDANHISRVLDDYDLFHIDGIVAVGGDGTVGQIIKALMDRLDRESGIARNDLDSPVKCIKLPIGHIPTGSGNCVAIYLYGTMDIKTCAISIALGKTTSADLMVVHNNSTFLGYGQVMVGHGFTSKVHAVNDRLRWWARKLRYYFFPLLTFWYFEIFHIHLQYKGAAEEDDAFHGTESFCFNNIADCDVNSQGMDDDDDDKLTICGRFTDVLVSAWECKDFLHRLLLPRYRKPNLNTGKMFLYLATSRSYLKTVYVYLKAMLFGPENISNPEVMGKLSATEVNITAVTDERIRKNYKVCIDGENFVIEDSLNLHIRVSADVLRYFCIDDDRVSRSYGRL